MRCVWHGFAQDAKRSLHQALAFIECRGLRSERRLRCVWGGFEEAWDWEDEDWKTGTYHLTRSTL